MKWRNKKQSPDIEYHNEAAKRRLNQEKANGTNSTNDSAKEKAERMSSKKNKRRKKVGNRIAELKTNPLSTAIRNSQISNGLKTQY